VHLVDADSSFVTSDRIASRYPLKVFW